MITVLSAGGGALCANESQVLERSLSQFGSLGAAVTVAATAARTSLRPALRPAASASSDPLPFAKERKGLRPAVPPTILAERFAVSLARPARRRTTRAIRRPVATKAGRGGAAALSDPSGGYSSQHRRAQGGHPGGSHPIDWLRGLAAVVVRAHPLPGRGQGPDCHVPFLVAELRVFSKRGARLIASLDGGRMRGRVRRQLHTRLRAIAFGGRHLTSSARRGSEPT